MFDPVAFAEPQKFDATRSLQNAFHFGYGIHECLGRHIGRQMIPEIVRQVLLLPGIRAAGKVDKKRGPVPERYRLRWDTKSDRSGLLMSSHRPGKRRLIKEPMRK
jgi:cytochrome P450